MQPRRDAASRLAIAGLLFLSGATGLTYEVVWSRLVANVIGSSGEANAVVLSTFMGGLALGAYLFGRRADRTARPLALYGLLELGVAATALALPFVLGVGARFYFALAPGLPSGGRLVLRLLLASAALLPPTLLMGGTLPALVRHFAQRLSQLRLELARLYGVNSLGACFGALVSGVGLIPSIGLTSTLRFAAFVNVLLGAMAWVLSRASSSARPIELTTPEPEVIEREPSATTPLSASESGRSIVLRLRMACAGLALTGFSALLGEVAFIRLLSVVLGSSPYAFTLIVAAYVLGIGVGSQWLSARNPTTDSLRLFGFLQLALVAAVSVAVPLYARLPYLFWNLSDALHHTYATWPLYQLVTFVISLAVVGVPAFFLGAAFPCGARAATSQARAMGRDLGSAYLWNTLGTVAGAGLGGLVLLPWLGLEGVFALVMVAHLLAATLALVVASPGRRLRGASWIACVALAMVFCMLSERGWSTLVASLGAFRFRDEPPSSYAEMRDGWSHTQTPLFHQDDASASVAVVEHRETATRTLRVNGKADASSQGDMGTQILLGQLGVLLHPRDVKRALVVGLGSGITAGSVLSHPVERVDVVELSPAVAQAARFFASENHHALDDPRLRLHLEDAKTFLSVADGKYDLVISEPSNPWTAGAASLFTQDFFRRVAEHMTDDGVLVQWCHTYENATPLVKLVVRTMRDTFPHAVGWAGTEDVLFIASRRPLAPVWNELVRRMDRPAAKADLARAGIDDAYTLLAIQAQSDEGNARFAGPGPLNTDDLNLLEFAAPVAFYLDARVALNDERRRPGPQPLWIQTLAPGGLTASRAKAIHSAYLGMQRSDAPLVRSIAERWLALDPMSDEAAEAVAESALLRGDLGAAEKALRPRLDAVSHAPRLVADALQLAAAQCERSRSLFQPSCETQMLELAVWARQNLRGDARVQSALDRFDAARR